MALHRLCFDATDSDTRGDSHQVGAILYDQVNDRLGVINASQELLVKDDDVETAIENISKAEDSIHVSGDLGVMSLAVRNDAGTALAADGDYIPLSTDATGALRVNSVVNIDSQSQYAEDSGHVSGDLGEFFLSIRIDDIDGANSAYLAGTEGDYQGLFTNDKGELHVRDNDVYDQLVIIDAVLDTIKVDTGDISVDTGVISTNTTTIAGDTTSIDATLTSLSKAEDSVHVSGDDGIMALGVRNDAGTPLAADGDYIPMMFNSDGALYVTDMSPSADTALANTALKQVAETVGVAAAVIVDGADELSDRKYVFVYNNSNRDAFIGDSGVTVGNGFPIPPCSILEARIGAAVDVYMIGDKAGMDIRTLQLS